MAEAGGVLAALNSLAFLLCAGYLTYLVAIIRPLLAHEPSLGGDGGGYDVHIVVPCLDEERVIEATVRHLCADFPRARIWCVDDASSDATPQILARLERELPHLTVITRTLPQAQQGKGPALNAAWRWISASLPPDADREECLVGVVDADGRLQRTALDTIAGPRYFGDPEVAAVQLRVRVTEDVDALASSSTAELAAGPTRRDSLLVQLQDLEFVGPIAAMQMLRRRTRSVGMGGNAQFTRMSVLDGIAFEHRTPWHGALLEDFELGLHVLLLGRRTEYCDEAFVAQAGLPGWRRLLRQRSRWSQGGIQCSVYMWNLLSSPRVPLSAALEISYYLFLPWSQLLGSVVFPLAIWLDVHYLLSTAGGGQQWWVAGAWGVLPLALLFGVLPVVLWGYVFRLRTGAVSRPRALLLGLANLGYNYLLQAAVWWAFWRVLRGRTDWKKTARATWGSASTTSTATTSLTGARA